MRECCPVVCSVDVLAELRRYKIKRCNDKTDVHRILLTEKSLPKTGHVKYNKEKQVQRGSLNSSWRLDKTYYRYYKAINFHSLKI
jgi:hypothetical protein